MDTEHISPIQDEANARRRKMRAAKRDETGFSTESLPHLTTQQVKWIAARATVSSNKEATELVGADPLVVMSWMDDPDFLAVLSETMENKREGFKQLATQALPTVLQTLLDVMERGDTKAADRVKAASLLMRNQGLLVDRVQSTDPDAIRALLDEIRKPRPVIKTLPNPKDNYGSQE